MAKIDEKYHKLLQHILDEGYKYEDPNRKGIYRYQIPHYTIEHNFSDGFPAITTKKLYWKGVVGELLWILRGDTNIKYLVDNGINIWNKDAYNYYLKQGNEAGHKPNDKVMLSFTEWLQEIKEDEELLGNLGRVYGAQLRNWTANIESSWVQSMGQNHKTVIPKRLDQISNLIKGLKGNPMGTRHIVTAWNPAELGSMALPPCHWSFEILVEPLTYGERVKKIQIHHQSTIKKLADGHKYFDKLNIPKHKFTLKWHQRSVDSFLGKM